MGKKTGKEKIILGIDPGTSIMGYGVVMVKGPVMSALQMGVIHLNKLESHELRLHKIFDRVLAVIDEFNPDEVALEAPFYGKNVQSMIKLGRAQGVAMAASLHRKIPIFEYAPRKVKQSVTGSGNASKEQVASMLINLFKVDKIPEHMDATDALAVAVCHHHQNGMGNSKKSTWKGFIKDNPTRVRK